MRAVRSYRPVQYVFMNLGYFNRFTAANQVNTYIIMIIKIITRQPSGVFRHYIQDIAGWCSDIIDL